MVFLYIPSPHTTSPTAEPSHAPCPPALSLASIAPLVSTSTAPTLSWLSEHLSPACKAGKTPRLDTSTLSSMVVPHLLSFGWRQRQKMVERAIKTQAARPPSGDEPPKENSPLSYSTKSFVVATPSRLTNRRV